MTGIVWILVGGMTGWLTGTFMGEQGYGKSLLGGYARSLDIVLGIVGAFFGGYLFFWAVIGEASSFSTYATAVFGSCDSRWTCSADFHKKLSLGEKL